MPTDVWSGYDVLLFDLDGVVYVGTEPVDGVPAALADLRRRGRRLAFVTNNASRTSAAVADQLTAMGVPARAGDVVTSAQAAALYAAECLPAGAPVLVLGTAALSGALAEQGLMPVAGADAGPAAVVQGFSPDLGWADLAEAALAIRAGARWIACNSDATLPSTRGLVPGNGSLVAALAHTTESTPTFVGKPHPAMHRVAIERTGARRPLIIGDRLDTDIAAATSAGCDSVLVLSGITTPVQLLAAAPAQRPTYVGLTAGDLLRAPRTARADGDRFSCGLWSARREGRSVSLSFREPGTESAIAETRLDAVLALCAAAWHGSAESAAPARGRPLVVAADRQASAVLRHLGIPAHPGNDGRGVLQSTRQTARRGEGVRDQGA